jgi:hypothetical protein
LGIFFILIITILIIYISYKKNSLFFKNKINKNINYNEDEDGSDLSDGSDISFGDDDKNVDSNKFKETSSLVNTNINDEINFWKKNIK